MQWGTYAKFQDPDVNEFLMINGLTAYGYAAGLAL